MTASLAQITVQLSAQQLAHQATRAGFVLLAAFLSRFALIRTSARPMRSPRVPWWPGSVKTAGGLHVHHLVFGIVLILLAGFVAIAVRLKSPWLELTAAGVGVGGGLTLDEYALWLHLEDVYWAEEGRRSVDAVIVAAVVAGLILLGAQPLGASDTGSVVEVTLAVLVVLALSAVALAKGRIMLGIAGLVFSSPGAVRGRAPRPARIAVGPLAISGSSRHLVVRGARRWPREQGFRG